MILRAVAFLALFVLLQLSWQSLRGTAAERLIIHDCTVVPAAHLVNLLTPSVHARAVDFSVRAPGGGLNVLNGCEGMEALFLLAAAFAVVPMPWRERVAGLLLGVAVVFLVNQVRILLLFYAFRAGNAWFDPLHGMITPIGVILAVSAYFYAWLVYSSRRVAAAT
jgi:exosortase/archaeosortase family protein